ncbi:MFS transporter [Verrucomicrobia bacterium S94]|nr:MFS transporter [Verrucomicrobia bacterium S94]
MKNYQRNAFIFATIVAIGGLVFGIDAVLISGTTSYITEEFGLTPDMLGNVVSSTLLGVLIALPFVGPACNSFGRKRVIQIIAVLYLISAVGSTFAPGYWTLFIARFIGGLAFSSITLASMYIGEISPPSWRGKLVAMTQINIVIGLTLAYFINDAVFKASVSGTGWAESLGFADHTWRWMLGSEIPAAAIWLVLLFFIPESPSWLFYKGREAEARSVLTKLLSDDEIDHHLDEMRESMAENAQEHDILTQFKEIFGRRMRLILVIAVTFAIAQQASGINAIMFYATTVVEQLGFGTDAAFTQTVLFGVASLVFTIVALLLVDKIGRRPLIVGGMLWIIASLGVGAYSFSQATYTLQQNTIVELTDAGIFPQPERLEAIVGVEYHSDVEFKAAINEVLGEKDARNNQSLLIQNAAQMNAMLIFICMLSFIAAFHFSIGPIMWIVFSEIFPISLRGIAIPLFGFISTFVSWSVAKFFPVQLDKLGMASTLLTYAGFVAAGLVVLFFTFKETKGLSIEEIQQKLVIKTKV